jgi:hypothetical protein
MTIQFEDAIRPEKVTRVVNPFTEVVASMVGSDAAKAFTVPQADVSKSRRQLTEAAHAANVTVRTIFADPDKAGNVKITFWTVERITRKPKDEAEVKPAAKPAAPARKAATRRK